MQCVRSVCNQRVISAEQQLIGMTAIDEVDMETFWENAYSQNTRATELNDVESTLSEV